MPAPTVQQTSLGTQFFYSLDGSTWLTVGRVISVKRNAIKAGEIPTTGVADTAKRRQAAMPDYDSIDAVVTFGQAIVTAFIGLMNARTSFYLKVRVPDASQGSGFDNEVLAGYLGEFDPYGELDENGKDIRSTMKFMVDGTSTWTPNASS